MRAKIQEDTMNHVCAPLRLMISGAVVASACAVGGLSASAQTITSSTSAAPTGAAKKPASATPQMIQEAIKRSQARSQKLKTEGKAEQFGSEEPFTFDPKK